MPLCDYAARGHNFGSFLSRLSACFVWSKYLQLKEQTVCCIPRVSMDWPQCWEIWTLHCLAAGQIHPWPSYMWGVPSPVRFGQWVSGSWKDPLGSGLIAAVGFWNPIVKCGHFHTVGALSMIAWEETMSQYNHPLSSHCFVKIPQWLSNALKVKFALFNLVSKSYHRLWSKLISN